MFQQGRSRSPALDCATRYKCRGAERPTKFPDAANQVTPTYVNVRSREQKSRWQAVYPPPWRLRQGAK